MNPWAAQQLQVILRPVVQSIHVGVQAASGSLWPEDYRDRHPTAKALRQQGPDGSTPMQIVVAPLDKHQQALSVPQHDASLSGEIRAPASHIRPMPLDERRIIGHRAMLEITRPNSLINLGIGMPEVCPTLWNRHLHSLWTGLSQLGESVATNSDASRLPCRWPATSPTNAS